MDEPDWFRDELATDVPDEERARLRLADHREALRGLGHYPEHPSQLDTVGHRRGFASLADGQADLSVVQRILLDCDGTVTHILEALAQEPMVVVKLAHATVELATAMPELDLVTPAQVVTRTVLLSGAASGRVLLHAHTTIAFTNLSDAGIERDLRLTRDPIGTVLTRHRTELFREHRQAWTERSPLLAEVFGASSDATILGRTYCMFAASKPIILITERFSPNLAHL